MSPASLRAEVFEAALAGVDLGNLSAIVDIGRSWNPDSLARAVEGLVRAFPVLGCRFQRHPWRARWTPVSEPLADILRHRPSEDLEADTARALSEPIDVFRTRPLRVTLLTHAGGSRLVLNMPHLVADGNGVLTTLRELAAQLMGQGLPGPVPMERSVWQLGRALGWRSLPRILSELLREVRRMFAVPRVRPWAVRLTPSAPRDVAPMRRLQLSETQSLAFQALCRSHGATVNDGLVAAALGVGASALEDGLTGAAYTINLRRFLHQPGPIVANLSGYTMVTQPARAAREPVRVLPRVSAITGEQKSRLPGVGSLLLPMALFGWLSHGLAHHAGRLFRGLMTGQARRLVVMTNVGVMEPYLAPFGELALDAWMTPPTVPGFPAPLCLATSFRGRLSLCLGGPRELTPAPVDGAARRWSEVLERMLAQAPEATARTAAGR